MRYFAKIVSSLAAILLFSGISTAAAAQDHADGLQSEHHGHWVVGANPTVWGAVSDGHRELLVGGGVFVEHTLVAPVELEFELRGMRAPEATELTADVMLKLAAELSHELQAYFGAGPTFVLASEDAAEEHAASEPGGETPEGEAEEHEEEHEGTKTHVGVAFALGAMVWLSPGWGVLYQLDFNVFPGDEAIYEVGGSVGAVVRL